MAPQERKISMRTPIALVATLAMATATSGAPVADRFGWFTELVGSCWIGRFPDGERQHTQCYTTQFDKFIRGTAQLDRVKGGTISPLFAGDSLFTWDESTARIVYYIWGSDGSHSKHEAYYEGQALVFPVESRKEPGKISYRSVWARIDKNSFDVRREVPDGAGWKTELTVRYGRRGPAP
jgi:hypothetical protein